MQPTTRSVSLFLWLVIASLQRPGASASADEAEPHRVEDRIAVTSDKREQELSDVAEAVSVVRGRALTRLNIDNLDDVNGLAPGLTVAKNDGAGRVVAIRGVGWETAQNLSTQPGVLLYIDGVYVVNPLAFAIDLESIERIEVFRGPQGTEFGHSKA